MKFLFSLCLCFLSIVSKAQTLFGTSGGSVSNASFQFDFSVGEAAIADVADATNRLNIGFQQPYYDFFTSTSASETENHLLYPNPFAGSFQFSSSSQIERYILFDTRGKEVFRSDVRGYTFTHTDRPLPKGVYSLRVVFKNDKHLNTLIICQ